jgi:hypothetical protein
MSNDPLVLDFIEWVAKGRRSYTEVIDAWRTSCPRLTILEDAMDRGLVVRDRVDGKSIVVATHLGLDLLRASGRAPPTIQSRQP